MMRIDRVSAQESMAIDAHWIDTLNSLTTIKMRAYQWRQKSCTYGYFIKPEDHIDCDKAREYGFDLACRPTGGGMLFHYHDFSYTVAVPKTHPRFSDNVLANYHFVNTALWKAVSCVIPGLSVCESSMASPPFAQFCMATATKYDLLVDGKKIAGSAQRKTKEGFVHQGSLFLALPDWQEVGSIMRTPSEALSLMQQSSIALFENGVSDEELARCRLQIATAFFEILSA